MNIRYGWIFDADGVLFDAHDPKIKRQGITDFIFQRLEKGEPVAINSGRKVDFTLEKLMPGLRKKGLSLEALKRFIVVGEKGAVVILYENGEEKRHVDETMTVPDQLRVEIFDVIRKEYKDSMFEGEIKPTMVSPQKRGEEEGGVSLRKFHEDQQKFIPQGREIIEKLGLTGKIKIDQTNISTDFETIHAGKDLGARKILAYWRKVGIMPDQIYTFGDSKSDRKMADEIHKQEVIVHFVWVGKKNIIKIGDHPYPVIKPKGIHDEATEAFLNNFTAKEK